MILVETQEREDTQREHKVEREIPISHPTIIEQEIPIGHPSHPKIIKS